MGSAGGAFDRSRAPRPGKAPATRISSFRRSWRPIRRPRRAWRTSPLPFPVGVPPVGPKRLATRRRVAGYLEPRRRCGGAADGGWEPWSGSPEPRSGSPCAKIRLPTTAAVPPGSWTVAGAGGRGGEGACDSVGGVSGVRPRPVTARREDPDHRDIHRHEGHEQVRVPVPFPGAGDPECLLAQYIQVVFVYLR